MTDEELGKRLREIVSNNEGMSSFNSSILVSLQRRWKALYDLIMEVK